MPTVTSDLCRVYPNVKLADDVVLEEFVIVGKRPRGSSAVGQTTIAAGGLIRSHTVIYAGCSIGEAFQCGHHTTIREETRIGRDVSIGTGGVVEHHVTIEDGVRLHSNVFVPEFSVLKKGCWIGPNVVMTNAKYPRSPDVKASLRGPTILSGARVGANATILPGVTVGENSLIGAGAVVTHDVPDEAVVYGSPAVVHGRVGDLPYGSQCMQEV